MTLKDVVRTLETFTANHGDEKLTFNEGLKVASTILRSDSDYTLRDRLETWKTEIIEYGNSDHSDEVYIGPLYDMAINGARKEMLDGIERLLEGKSVKGEK